MSTDTLERVDIRTDEQLADEVGNGLKHYFTKKDLDENLLTGKSIKAACGFIRNGLANPGAELPVCGACKWLYENVMKGGDDE